jgi:hypothetical protein
MGHHHLLAAILAVALLAAGAGGVPWQVCGTTSGFEPNSTFAANLNRIAATLPSNASTSPDLYATASAGAVPERVWAMALCRGDVNATECRDCLTQAFRDVQALCSMDKDASIYYNPCTLHYSDVHTLPSDDVGPITDAYPVLNNGNVTSDPARYSRVQGDLLNATADHAAFNSTRRFATGEADFDDPEFPKVYAVAQCPPDQPPEQCRRCLARIIADNWWVFKGHIGGRLLWVNCTYRFETQPFYTGPPMVRLALPSSGAPAPAVETPAAAGGGETDIAVQADGPSVD